MCAEFRKRLDPELPFYYYTTSYNRFYEGELPAFGEKSSRPRVPRRPPRLEQPGLQVGRRITLAARGQGSLRARFHNIPVDLPPPPTLGSEGRIGHEHSYASAGPS